MGEAAGAGVSIRLCICAMPVPRRSAPGAIGQLGQMGIPIGQLDLGHALAFSCASSAWLLASRASTCNSSSRPWWGPRPGKRPTACIVTTDQQVLAGVIARRSAGRRAQAHPANIAPHVIQRHHLQPACAPATRRAPGRRPTAATIAQGHRHARHRPRRDRPSGVLADLPFHQQRGAELAVAIAAAVRSAVAEALRGGQDGFAGWVSSTAPEGCRVTFIVVSVNRSRDWTTSRPPV